jgi:hypothetical protein
MEALTAEVNALDQLLEPVRDCLTAEVATRLLELRASPEILAKLDLFAEKHAEGQISLEELAEYEAFIRAGNLIAVLQAKARSLVHPKS